MQNVLSNELAHWLRLEENVTLDIVLLFIDIKQVFKLGITPILDWRYYQSWYCNAAAAICLEAD